METRWPTYKKTEGCFPKGFLWGCATASFQIEGGYAANGKTKSVWDVFCEQPGTISDGSDGKVACDSFNRWQEDIELLKQLKVNAYRFSISWPRVISEPFKVNKAGLEYYQKLIGALLEAKITPLVTMNHWDMPQYIEDEGGWLSQRSIEHFRFYAETLYKHLGDRVQWWVTHNEPWVMAKFGYGLGIFAPGVKNAEYLAAHNLILAHAEAYRLYDAKFRKTQKGKVGIVLNTTWFEPKDKSNESDKKATERAIEFHLGWFAEPIFGNGDYPTILKQQVAAHSSGESSNLPRFTEEQQWLVRGSADFFGLNHYTTRYVTAAPSNPGDSSYNNCVQCEEHNDPSWPRAESKWLYVVPWGIERLLVYIKDHYKNPEIIVTENGMSDKGQLDDELRGYYYENYINYVLRAIKEGNCRVTGYMAWSLMDNFEWANGYQEKFGLFQVDFNDQNRKRTAKNSVALYRRIIINNGFPAESQDEH